MPWIAAGGAIAGGLIGASGAKKSAEEMTAASKKAVKEARRQFDITDERLSPYRRVGNRALFRMSELLGINPYGGDDPRFGSWSPNAFGALDMDPGYQFRRQQGEEAMLADASRRGLRLSPATQKALARFNSDLASQEFGNAFNRLAGTAGMGQNAAVQAGSFGQNMANMTGNAIMSGGSAQAAGTVGSYNALAGGVGQAVNIWNQNRMLDQYLRAMGGPSYGAAGPTSNDIYPGMPHVPY